jgi:murein DD-endopeptidase MepM/ murein hydrolase activator NlpD
MTISVKSFSGRAGGPQLGGSFALVVLMSLAAPITALAKRGADVVPMKDQAPVGQTILPQAQRDSPDITPQIRFGWPAAGGIIEGFYWHPYDERNDGINIAVEPETEVHAVEAGRIAYAGDEIRGLHNLILISHRNGWVSAYAKPDGLLVKRGDSVERGYVIARFGDGDRLHFELRHNPVSVDPLLYLGDVAPARDVAQMLSGQCRG